MTLPTFNEYRNDFDETELNQHIQKVLHNNNDNPVHCDMNEIEAVELGMVRSESCSPVQLNEVYIDPVSYFDEPEAAETIRNVYSKLCDALKKGQYKQQCFESWPRKKERVLGGPKAVEWLIEMNEKVSEALVEAWLGVLEKCHLNVACSQRLSLFRGIKIEILFRNCRKL